jgi:hypothetical protein
VTPLKHLVVNLFQKATTMKRKQCLFFLSHADEALNAGEKTYQDSKAFNASVNLSDEAKSNSTLLKNLSDEAFKASSPCFVTSSQQYHTSQTQLNSKCSYEQYSLKGQSNEIFLLPFFSLNGLSWSQ